MDTSGLRAQSITKCFPTRSGDLTVLRGITLALVPSDSVALMGPSGSGKSTLLNILGTLEPPTAGTVTFDGRNPFDLTERELARFRNRTVGFVFQEHHLLPQCSALENVLLPALAMRDGGDATARGRELMDRVGLQDRLHHRPAELSGGERQRVAIARALINRPKLLLADEPTGNLDRATAESVTELLLELQGEEDLMLLTVTHNERLADRHQRRYDMVDGNLVASSQG